MVSDHGGRSCTTIDCNLRVSRFITEFIHNAIKNGIVEEGMLLMEDKFPFIVDKYLSKYSTVPMAYIFHHDLMYMYCKEYSDFDSTKRGIIEEKLMKINTKLTKSYSTTISSQHMVGKELR